MGKTTQVPVRRSTTEPQMLRTGERADFRRCPQRWWWKWREGLTKPFQANSLWFGEGIHFALAEWYQPGKKRGPDPAQTFLEWVDGERRRIFTQPKVGVDETEIVDAAELGVAMLQHYVEHYGKDGQYKFIATEQSTQWLIPAMKMSTKARAIIRGINLRDTLYCSTFDGVYRDESDGKIWLIEHKTSKDCSTRHLPLDDQAGSYWAVATHVLRKAGIMKDNEELEGILYNFLRKSKPDQRARNAEGMYLNKDGGVSKQQPAPYFIREPVFRFPQERATQFERIQAEHFQMQLMRAGVLPVTKNPTGACWWDCPFWDMCQLHESKDDWEDYRDMIYTVEDPYEKHRKSAAS